MSLDDEEFDINAALAADPCLRFQKASQVNLYDGNHLGHAKNGAFPISLENDIDRLMRAWINERAAPELLYFEGHLMEHLKEQLEQQEEMVDAYRGQSVEGNFGLMLVETEMERVKYLIRSYARARLHKVSRDDGSWDSRSFPILTIPFSRLKRSQRTSCSQHKGRSGFRQPN